MCLRYVFFFLSRRAFCVHSFSPIFFHFTPSPFSICCCCFFICIIVACTWYTRIETGLVFECIFKFIEWNIILWKSPQVHAYAKNERKKRPVSKIHTVEPGESDRKRWKCNLSNMLGALVLARYDAEQHFGQQMLLVLSLFFSRSLTVHTFWMNDFRIKAKWVDKPFCMLLTLSMLAVILKVNVKLDRKQTSNNILPDWNTIAKMGIQSFFLASRCCCFCYSFALFALRHHHFVVLRLLYVGYVLFTHPCSVARLLKSSFSQFIAHIWMDWIGVKRMRIWIKSSQYVRAAYWKGWWDCIYVYI